MTPREAEVAADNHYKSLGAQTKRALRTKWASVDFFGCDVIARMPDRLEIHNIQVTMGKDESIRARRRKLEAIYWTPSDHVFVFQVIQRPAVTYANRVDYFFKVHQMTEPGNWKILPDPIPITREMMKVGRKNKA